MRIHRIDGWVVIYVRFMGREAERMAFEDFRWAIPGFAATVMENVAYWQECIREREGVRR